MLGFLAGIPGRMKTLLDRLTAARAGYLDNLAAGPVAQASTALSTATWTNGLAAELDALAPAIAALPTGTVRSIQTGYKAADAAPLSSTGEDSRYYDITITAVTNTAKCLVFWFPGNSNSGISAMPRLTSTTNLRLASGAAGAMTVQGRWYVVAFF
jgi:hypothetical protein